MRSRRGPAIAVVMMMAVFGLFAAGPGPSMTGPWGAQAAAPATSRGLTALDAAARSGKYLFVFFWKADDEQTRTMYGVFQSAMAKWADSTDSIGILITDPREKAMADKFGVRRAPMPLVVAIAPNGAITKGFPVQFDENQLQTAFVSPCAAKCLKALQDRKLVLLCVQNQRTEFTQAAIGAAQSFKADRRYAQATEIVTLNPDHPAEIRLLDELQVNPRTPEAVTVLLAPPGQPVAKFAGAVTKDEIVAKVASAQSGCCPGGKCGPGGCGPSK